MNILKKVMYFFLLILFTNSFSTAKNLKNSNYLDILNKKMIISTGQFDGNNMRVDIENNGMIVSHRISGHSGLEWPAGSDNYSVYAAGFWYIGYVDGELCSAVAEYGPECTAGPYGSTGDESEYRLYKVNRSDLENPLANVDFALWPVSQGAPWIDENNNGIYEPLPGGSDHPEFLGDQVIFFVMNDAVENNHTIFSTNPLGIEIRTTLWGFDRSDAVGDMLFVKTQLFNKGGKDIDSLIVELWSDPDLGSASDDFVGCDPSLSGFRILL